MGDLELGHSYGSDMEMEQGRDRGNSRTCRPVPFPSFTANIHLNRAQPGLGSIWQVLLLISMHPMVVREWQEHKGLLGGDWDFGVSVCA